PASPGAPSTKRCCGSCPRASTHAARTASSTPAPGTARCSPRRWRCAAGKTSSATGASSIPTTSCRSGAGAATVGAAMAASLSRVAARAPLLQVLRVPGDVLADEAGDEVVAVVVAGLHAQGQRVAGGFAGLAQQLGPQFALEELVVRALVHQQR